MFKMMSTGGVVSGKEDGVKTPSLSRTKEVKEETVQAIKSPSNETAAANPVDLASPTGKTGPSSWRLRRNWFSSVLTDEDFVEVDPHRGKFVLELKKLSSKREEIMVDETIGQEEKEKRVAGLRLAVPDSGDGSGTVMLDDLW